MGPYSLTSVGPQAGSITAQDTFSPFMIQPYQINTGGTLPGTTNINLGQNVQISGTEGNIVFLNGGNKSIQIGLLTDGKEGLQFLDDTGFVVAEFTGSTWYWYDKSSGKNIMQIGLLPDGTYGWAVAAPGYNVADGFA